MLRNTVCGAATIFLSKRAQGFFRSEEMITISRPIPLTAIIPIPSTLRCAQSGGVKLNNGRGVGVGVSVRVGVTVGVFGVAVGEGVRVGGRGVSVMVGDTVGVNAG